MSTTPCRVLIVDDSAVVRQILTEILSRDPGIEVVGSAADPLLARDKIKRLNPDVLTLDVEMPRMDGLAFLENLMRLHPMPVVMVSTLTERGAEVTMRALELGAVDFVAKPRIGLTAGIQQLTTEITDKIRVASKARVHRLAPAAAAQAGQVAAAAARPGLLGRLSTEKIIAIGASTGGTEAIREVLTPMPADSPAIVITQHMPPGFTTSFAARLNSLCQITVKEAQDGERILPGHAYMRQEGASFTSAAVVPITSRWSMMGRP